MPEIVFTPDDQDLLERVRSAFPDAFEQAVSDARPILGEERTKKLSGLLERDLLRTAEDELVAQAIEHFIDERSGIKTLMKFRDEAIDSFTHATRKHAYGGLGDFADSYAPSDDSAETIWSEERALLDQLQSAGLSAEELDKRIALYRKDRPNVQGPVWSVIEELQGWLQERFF